MAYHLLIEKSVFLLLNLASAMSCWYLKASQHFRKGIISDRGLI